MLVITQRGKIFWRALVLSWGWGLRRESFVQAEFRIKNSNQQAVWCLVFEDAGPLHSMKLVWRRAQTNKLLLMTRHHHDLKLLVSRWSYKSDTRVHPNPRRDRVIDVVVMFREANAIGFPLEEDDEVNLRYLTSTVTVYVNDVFRLSSMFYGFN